MENNEFKFDYVMGAAHIERKSGERVWKYAVKWKCGGFIQYSYETDSHFVFQNNPTLLEEFWAATVPPGGTSDTSQSLSSTVVPHKIYIERMHRNVLELAVTDGFDDQAFSDLENTENKPPRKKSRLTVSSESEDDIVQFQSSLRETGSVAGNTSEEEGSLFGDSAYFDRHGAILKSQQKQHKVKMLPGDESPVSQRLKSSRTRTVPQPIQQKAMLLTFNSKAKGLESRRLNNIAASAKRFPGLTQSPNMNAKHSSNMESDFHVGFDPMDVDISPDINGPQVPVEFFTAIHEHPDPDEDLPDYDSGEDEEILPETEAMITGTDDEDLYVPHESPALPSMDQMNGIAAEPLSTTTETITIRSAPLHQASHLPADIHMADPPSPPTPQDQPADFTLAVKGNELSIGMFETEIDMDNFTLPEKFYVDGLYSLEGILASKAASNWINKGFAKLHLRKIDATHKVHWNELENELLSQNICIITSWIPGTDDALIIFSSRCKSFGVKFTGQPIRQFGFAGVLVAELVTIPGQYISCSKMNF